MEHPDLWEFLCIRTKENARTAISGKIASSREALMERKVFTRLLTMTLPVG
ncbi:MAG: hypothetical protein KGM16_19145 [Bacteroidota bacterium]|nr:hypothetical protein [Bacteroidota bacterium]